MERDSRRAAMVECALKINYNSEQRRAAGAAPLLRWHPGTLLYLSPLMRGHQRSKADVYFAPAAAVIEFILSTLRSPLRHLPPSSWL